MCNYFGHFMWINWTISYVQKKSDEKYGKNEN